MREENLTRVDTNKAGALKENYITSTRELAVHILSYLANFIGITPFILTIP